jgi:hypothetical protein
MKITCPACGTESKVHDDHADKKLLLRCHACGANLVTSRGLTGLAPSEPVKRDPRLVPRRALSSEVLEHAYKIEPALRGIPRLRVIRSPSFSGPQAWVLCEKPYAPVQWTVRRVTWGQQTDVQAYGETWQGGTVYEVDAGVTVRDIPVPVAAGQHALARLGVIRLPLGFEAARGFDGYTTTLIAGSLFGTATLSWWVNGPPEWAELNAFATWFIEWADNVA